MSTSQTERQNVFGKLCKEERSLDNSLEGEASADNEFVGLINSTEYLVDGTHEIAMDQHDGQLLLPENNVTLESNGAISTNDEYFLEHESLPNMHNHEESFILSTEHGNISVTTDDLLSVGVDLTSNMISIDSSQTNELLKLMQDRGQLPVQYVTNFETVDPKSVENESGPSTSSASKAKNYYAYIDKGSLLLFEDKTDKQVARFDRTELKRRFGISDVNKISDGELQKMAQTVVNQLQLGDSTFGDQPSTSKASKEVKSGANFIGETVEIVSRGCQTPRKAIVRYMRANGKYKVQFENGQFEWIQASQIVRTNVGPFQKKIKKPVVRTIPTDKRVIKPPDGAAPNCTNCALCEKKITTPKPAFIVIRLPACKECAKTKALAIEGILSGIGANEGLVPNNPNQASNLISTVEKK